MNLHKIRMLRGKVIAGTPTRTVTKGQVLEIDLDDRKQEDLWHLVELAKAGVHHMGRNLCEYYVEGPTMSFSAEQLAIIKLAPVSAYPEIAAGLAKQIGTSPEDAAMQLAQALEMDQASFMPPAPKPGGFPGFSERELAQLRKCPPEFREGVVRDLTAAYPEVSREEAIALLVEAVGSWDIPQADAPTPEPTEAGLEAMTAPEPDPKAKAHKQGK